MGTTALVVDDDDSIRFVLTKTLEGLGIEVTAVDDGAEVLALVSRRHFDLLVIDLHMPGMNGFGVLRRIRQSGSGTLPRPRTAPGVPILVVSAESEAATVANARRLGASAQLSKPVDIDAFEAAVLALLGRAAPASVAAPDAAATTPDAGPARSQRVSKYTFFSSE